jgi:hypothetical protein
METFAAVSVFVETESACTMKRQSSFSKAPNHLNRICRVKQTVYLDFTFLSDCPICFLFTLCGSW